MTDPHWTSYVGMATGILGAITGISGAFLGFIGYRKSNEIKSLDLRLELRKSSNNLKSTFAQLEKLLPKSDQLHLEYLINETQHFNQEFSGLNTFALETELVNIHKLQLKFDDLKDTYNMALERSDKESERIRIRNEKEGRGTFN